MNDRRERFVKKELLGHSWLSEEDGLYNEVFGIIRFPKYFWSDSDTHRSRKMYNDYP